MGTIWRSINIWSYLNRSSQTGGVGGEHEFPPLPHFPPSDSKGQSIVIDYVGQGESESSPALNKCCIYAPWQCLTFWEVDLHLPGTNQNFTFFTLGSFSPTQGLTMLRYPASSEQYTCVILMFPCPVTVIKQPHAERTQFTENITHWTFLAPIDNAFNCAILLDLANTAPPSHIVTSDVFKPKWDRCSTSEKII